MKSNPLNAVKKWPGYQVGMHSPRSKAITVLLGFAGFWMVYFIWQYWGTEWQWFMIAMGAFAFAALYGIAQIGAAARLDGGTERTDRVALIYTVLRAAIIALFIVILQKIIQIGAILSISDTDLFFYYIFGAVCEEGFFRGVVCRGIPMVLTKANIKNKRLIAILAILGSTLAFLSIHVSYYSNLVFMLTVFVSGCVLGFCYLYWKDLLANIIAHVLVNLFAVLTILGIL